MQTLLDAWRSRQPLPKQTIILLMREFSLKCLETAYRHLDLKDKEIHQLLKRGRLTTDKVGRYKQSNYKQVAGLTPFYKQFKDYSSTFDRVMIGTVPTGANDWLAALRINTVRSEEGYRIAGMYTGLLRWGNMGTEIQERLLRTAEKAWHEHGWDLQPLPKDQCRENMWGESWHPGGWQGTEEELIEAIGARMAALVPVLRARHWWGKAAQRLTLFPRFQTLGKAEEALGQDPTTGSYEFHFRRRESRFLAGFDEPYIDATLNGQPIRFRITSSVNGERTLTSCEGAYRTIREVGLALGMRHGDRACFRPTPDGRYLVERADPVGILVKLGTVGSGEDVMDGRQTLDALEEYLQGHPFIWFGVHSGTPVSAGRLQEFRNAIQRGEPVTVYLAAGSSAGGDGDVTHVADLAAIESGTQPLPPPGSELLPGPTMGEPCRVWLRLTNLRTERIPLESFVLDKDGTTVKRGLRQPLVYVRRDVSAAPEEPIQLMGAAPALDEYLEEMQQFIDEQGAYMYPWTHGIRPVYRDRLEQQRSIILNLYRGGQVTHRCMVDRIYTTDEMAGMASPEPEFTAEQDQGVPIGGHAARTWLRVSSLEELMPPMPLDAFVEYDTGERLAPQALLNAFGYVREQQAEEESDPDNSESLEVRSLEEILDAFAASPTLVYDPTDVINLHHALHTLDHKHFVILHGVSGTGKSRFAQAYANALYGRALTEPDNPYYCLVPVQPTWQDRTPLLGYYNPLTERYVVPDFLAHVLKASRDPDHLYIL